MRRRDFMTVLAGAAAYPLLAGAQQKVMPVIGFLGISPPGANASRLAAFRLGLGDTGYVEGQNVTIESRSAEDRYDRLPALAADLVGRKIDVIVTQGTVVISIPPKGGSRSQLRVRTAPRPRLRFGNQQRLSG